MKCPKCRNVQLKRRGTAMLSEKHTGPFCCPICGGLWVRQEELGRISKYSLNNEPAEPDNARSAGMNPDAKTGLCPDGHGVMIRAKVHLEPHFYLEKCSTCGGIWFDHGELDRIIENNLDENLTVIWTLAWQRQQSQEKGREYYLNLNRELLGDDIYDAIFDLAGKLKDHPEQLRALALLHNEL